MLSLSLLRGINVGGKKVPMLDLRGLYADLGFKNITTYIQSGNVIFESKVDATSTTKKIEKGLKEKFGFDVSVILRTKEELNSVIRGNPFLKEKNIEEEKLYVIFLAASADKELVKKLEESLPGPERFIIKEKTIYLYCPVGYGEAKLNNNFFEKKLKVIATTRNWRTTNILLEMMVNQQV
jgi:uncharacterized protein (DUF1697 family)